MRAASATHDYHDHLSRYHVYAMPMLFCYARYGSRRRFHAAGYTCRAAVVLSPRGPWRYAVSGQAPSDSAAAQRYKPAILRRAPRWRSAMKILFAICQHICVLVTSTAGFVLYAGWRGEDDVYAIETALIISLRRAHVATLVVCAARRYTSFSRLRRAPRCCAAVTMRRCRRVMRQRQPYATIKRHDAASQRHERTPAKMPRRYGAGAARLQREYAITFNGAANASES